MARPIWKGTISFGLVTIPVGLHTAVESRGELHFRLLHRKDSSPIDYKRICEKENVEVAWADVVKGYEYKKGRFVVPTEEDFARARVPATQTFEILDFVKRADVDPMYFNHPYFLAPWGAGTGKSYALLRDAMADKDRLGIGKIVLRQREYLAALEASEQVLILTTLRFADELRNPKHLGLSQPSKRPTRKELDLAAHLIDSLASEWEPQRYRDDYEAVLRDLIAKKVKGEEIVAPKIERPAKVVDLMEALRASLSQPRHGGAKQGRSRRPKKAAA